MPSERPMGGEETAVGTAAPQVVERIEQLREIIAGQRRAGRSIGLVPTMGALHEGHLSLVRASRAACDFTVVTIFVNPTQFAAGEDLDRYPRTLEQDVVALSQVAADVVFIPAAEQMYPEGFSTYVEPPRVARLWEGQCRPDHFRGVATVVLKLFHLVPADVAFFGQKDYQQSLVIRHMVRDFNLPIRIEVCPIVREPDGLAMSSRNRYLDAPRRRQALALHEGLRTAQRLVAAGERDADAIRRAVRETLERREVRRIDYVALADPETLEEPPVVNLPTVVLLAARVGDTRLIDNCLLDAPGERPEASGPEASGPENSGPENSGPENSGPETPGSED